MRDGVLGRRFGRTSNEYLLSGGFEVSWLRPPYEPDLSGCFKERSDGVSGMAGGWSPMVSVWPVSACIRLT